jgi:hypothetical protein
VPSIQLWGKHVEEHQEKLRKDFALRWNNKKKSFQRKNVEKPLLKKIMNFCMKNKINYKTDDGQSYQVIETEDIEASSRELRDWGTDGPKGSAPFDEIDYEQMWDESHE